MIVISNMEKPKSCAECQFEVIDTSGYTRCVIMQEMVVDGNLFNRCPLEEIDLVRCKECKRCEERTTLNGLPFLYCLKMEVSVGSDQYCYWGERRNE